MNFFTEEWTIKDLLLLYENNKLNLNPPYQRNDIWQNPSKRKLIDSIKRNYPLPVFFLHDKGNDSYDIVDGQQRTRAIYGFNIGINVGTSAGQTISHVHIHLIPRYKGT